METRGWHWVHPDFIIIKKYCSNIICGGGIVGRVFVCLFMSIGTWYSMYTEDKRQSQVLVFAVQLVGGRVFLFHHCAHQAR